MKKCAKCDSEQPDGVAFCTNCGASMDSAPVAEENKAEEELTSSVEERPVAAPEPTQPEPVAPVVPESPVQTTSPEEKKTSHAGLIVVVVIAILFGIGGIVAAVIFGINSSKHGGGDDPSNPPADVVVTPPESVGSEVEIGGGYVVTVPDKYSHSYTDDGTLVIADARGEEWAFALFYMDDAPYYAISSNIDALAERYKEEYPDVSYGEKTIDGVELIYVDYLDESVGGLYYTNVYSAADDLYVFAANCLDSTGEINHDILDIVAEILNTVEKKSTISGRGFSSDTLAGVKAGGIDITDLGK